MDRRCAGCHTKTGLTGVELYEVVGGGNAEPSVAQRYREIIETLFGSQNGDIEMANEVWAFFQKF